MEILVRSADKMVFEVCEGALEPKRCSYYDPYCYSNPRAGCKYIEFGEWAGKRSSMNVAADGGQKP